MSNNDRVYHKALFKLELAKLKKSRKTKTEYNLFKELYFQLIVDKSLSKKDIQFQIQAHFKRQNLKLSRSKFFEFQHEIAEEERKKDWWVTKRKMQIEESRKPGAKEIIMVVIDPKDENPDEFINKKGKAIKDGIKEGSRKGGKATKKKFI